MKDSHLHSAGQWLTPSQAQSVDRIAVDELGISGLVLMENAGLRCADLIASRYSPRSCVILCGTGNNGGDGLVIARQLAVAGWPVLAVLTGNSDRLSPECRVNWQIFESLGMSQARCEIWPAAGSVSFDRLTPNPAMIIDAMLGISATGAPRSPLDVLCHWANQQTSIRVAVDVPTGVDPRTGEVPGESFRADWTLTIGCGKTYLGGPAALTHVGELSIVPLGLPAWVFARARAAA